MDPISFSTVVSLRGPWWVRCLKLSVRDSFGSPKISEMSESNTERKTSDAASVLRKVIQFSKENHWTSVKIGPGLMSLFALTL